ncbi:fibronectin type III domain-containing protein, partial [candidate division KSB1 bacterium]|nr:fibronectin type III domain-containing protein [candidate division KSB1 bacterium]
MMQPSSRLLGQEVLAILSVVLFPLILLAQPVTLVDFGADAGGTTFGLAEWNRLLLGGNLAYSAAGPGGVVQVADLGEYADFRGVGGTPRRFAVGERIVVTWYNTSDEVFRFTARISFTDGDRPQGGNFSGNWYTMRSFDDYRVTYVEIQAYGTARTVFNITDRGVHKSDSLYSLININTHIEWFQTAQKRFLLCDRIELWDDADVTPPAAVANLRATPVSHSRIDLEWDVSQDDVGVTGYLVYLNAEVEGYSEQPSYAAVLLEPAHPCSFAVAAIDAAGNESAPSLAVTASTQAFSRPAGALDPAGFDYLGAFKLPESFSWGGEALAFRSDGDPESTDGFPGSLYVTDLNQVQAGFVGEVSIPAPHKSDERDAAVLPEARVLTAPVNIRPASIDGWGDYVDIWRTGLEYVPAQNRLYSVWSVHYTVTGEKHASLSCTDAGA